MSRSEATASPRALAAQRLCEMLEYKRPARSETEEQFIADFIAPTGAESDAYGNRWLTIGQGSRVLWSCHTDSVHAKAGYQELAIANGVITAPKSNCLGADCAVGVWLMCEMISAKVPGTYVFHRDEEIGGRGSSFIAENHADDLSHFDYAIAFDRRGFNSVITHQGGAYGASDDFARSLALQLPKGFRPDATGIFTDTAQYVNHIAECTNVSVGYVGEHHPHESLSLSHATAMLSCLLAFDESKLVKARAPGDLGESFFTDWRDDWRGTSGLDMVRDLESLCRRYPDLVADKLEQYGFTLADFMD